MLKELITIANELDSRGLVKEASNLDDIIQALGLGRKDLMRFRGMISKDINAFKEWLNGDDLPEEESEDDAYARWLNETASFSQQSGGDFEEAEREGVSEETEPIRSQDTPRKEDGGPIGETAKELARDGAAESLFNLFF